MSHGRDPQGRKLKVAPVCRRVGMSRQNYHATHQRRQRQQVEAAVVVQLAQRERQRQPQLGGRKVYVLIKPELERAGVKAGRDRVLEILRQRDMLVPPPKAAYPCTTQSVHALPVFTNLMKDKELTGPNQAWASDITYIRTVQGFIYLALIMDLFSRKIVGFCAGTSLAASLTLGALQQALKTLPPGCHPLHHSDQGCQYCCHEYVALLQSRGLPVSMCEVNHCAENATAERLNGILKQEYGLGQEQPSRPHALGAIAQAVELYNTQRPHTSLKYQVPEVVHRQGGLAPAKQGERI